MLLVLAAVFAVLLVITIIQTAESAKPQRLPFERVYPSMDDDDVQAVRLRAPDTDITFTISRAPDGTWMTPDHQGSLDQVVAANIARTIALLPYDRTVPQLGDLSDYGFESEGRMALEVVMRTGETHGVLIGARAPSGSVYYALVDERPEIYLLYRNAIDFLITQLRTPPVA
jgi:hypothetical protein